VERCRRFVQDEFVGRTLRVCQMSDGVSAADAPGDIETVTEELLEVEAEFDLFERRIDGVHFWERVRFGVHRRLLRALGVTGQAHPENPNSRLHSVYQLLRNLAVRNPLLSPARDVLVYGHERRKLQADGLWWDVYCDPVVDALGEEVAHVERLPKDGKHRTPARTEGVRYLDAVQHGARLADVLLPDDVLLSAADRALLDRVEGELADRFGVDLELASLVGRKLLHRRVELPSYRALLSRVEPDIAVLVVSYGRETFVEACQRADVPVVELQHGVLSDSHLGYAYPGDRRKRTFPDHFLSFGEFWQSAVDLPLPDERVYPVGYPYLERRGADLAGRPTESRLVFVSQGTIGAALSGVAVDLAARNPEYEVVYKLHPGEHGRWRETYPWLVDAPIEVVDGDDERSLYELFATSRAQVGVYSTALYEGLCFDLETYVVDLPGASYVDRLVAEGGATLVGGAEGLPTTLDEGGSGFDTTRLFEPDPVSNVAAALERIRTAEAD
jgi:hypothetical protein